MVQTDPIETDMILNLNNNKNGWNQHLQNVGHSFVIDVIYWHLMQKFNAARGMHTIITYLGPHILSDSQKALSCFIGVRHCYILSDAEMSHWFSIHIALCTSMADGKANVGILWDTEFPFFIATKYYTTVNTLAGSPKIYSTFM